MLLLLLDEGGQRETCRRLLRRRERAEVGAGGAGGAGVADVAGGGDVGVCSLSFLFEREEFLLRTTYLEKMAVLESGGEVSPIDHFGYHDMS